MKTKRWRRIATGLLVGLLGASVVWAQGGYLQPFSVDPSAPQPARPGLDWDVTVHSDAIGGNWDALAGSPMEAGHGPDCAAPPATHHVATYDDAVFFCRNHIMTSIFADGGYGAIYLTPPQMLDWSTGEAVLSWDMSTLRTSSRDWVDVWLTPYADHLQAPLEDWIPDLQGPPRNAVHLRMDTGGGGTMFRTMVVNDFVTTEISGWQICCDFYEQVLTPDAARRDTFELHVSGTHLKFGMPAYNLWWRDDDLPTPLTFNQAVVQFGHHSYNPLKACPGDGSCGPNTWHWDNVSLSNAVPFTIGKVTPRGVGDAGNPPLTFDAPAPAGAELQFEAFSGSNIQVSWDGGATWANAPLAPESKHLGDHAEGYRVPVPEGATGVQVQGTGGFWGGGWQARDFSVWSQGLRRPTPTPVPAATVTPIPTATPGPTSTPQPSPTVVLPTAVPTSVVPTPGPRCGRVDIINGALVYTPLPDTACMQ